MSVGLQEAIILSCTTWN